MSKRLKATAHLESNCYVFLKGHAQRCVTAFKYNYLACVSQDDDGSSVEESDTTEVTGDGYGEPPPTEEEAEVPPELQALRQRLHYLKNVFDENLGQQMDDQKKLEVRRNGVWVYGSVGVVYRSVGMIYESVGVVYERVDVAYESVGVVYESVGVIYKSVGVVYVSVGVVYASVGVVYGSIYVVYRNDCGLCKLVCIL